jgi:septum formation protein
MTRLVLASTSPARRMLLTSAGLEFEAMKPDMEETDLKASMTLSDPAARAEMLAHAKAVSLAIRLPDAIVIGADQVLNFNGQAFDKPETIAEARRQLVQLRGREHWLEAAICCARGEDVLWQHLGRARLVMRPFTDMFLSQYLEQLGSDVLTSVGGYKLEGAGIQLFDTIEGEYFTILGLPLLPLLAFLRSQGAVAS